MATKQRTKKPEGIPQGILLQVPVVNIRTTSTNPRKKFNDEDITELAASIKSMGVLQPIVCMKADDDFIFTLICGERRYRAAQLAGLAEIPGIVYDPLPDDVVFEMQITENLQRKDINPMEESNAFSQLIKRGLKTAEQIADKLGVSTKYVYDRLSLQTVIPQVQDLISSDTISISHGKQFARLNKEDQEKLFQQINQDDSVQDIRRVINSSFTQKLADAIFETTDPILVKKAGACSKCPKHSGCNQLLFEDMHQEDICFDKSCFEAKTQAHLDQLYDSLVSEGKKVVKLSSTYSTPTNGIITRGEWDEVEAGKPYDALGIIVETISWNKEYPLGKVIPVELTADDDEEDKDLDDFLVTDPAEDSDYTTSNGTAKAERNDTDWDEKLQQKLEESIVRLFKHKPDTRIRSLIEAELFNSFVRLSDSSIELVSQEFDIELIPSKRSWSKYEERESIEAWVEGSRTPLSIEQLSNLTTLFNLLREIDVDSMLGDREEFDRNEQILQELGSSIYEYIRQINEEAGREVIQIPQPEEQEA